MKVHTDEGDALNHENLIQIRGMILNHFNVNQATPILPTQIASFIAANGETLNAIHQTHKRKMKGYNDRKLRSPMVKI